MSSGDGLGRQLSLSSNDFELFELPVSFKIQRQQLDERWKNLQRATHPDNFSMQDAASQRVAMQYSVRINEAYQRLKSPLKRAAYLCELNGVSIQAEENTRMPTDFLLQQLQWREQLEEAQTLADVGQLLEKVLMAKEQALTLCETYLDVKHDWLMAAGQVRALMFMERFEEDVDRRQEQLEKA